MDARSELFLPFSLSIKYSSPAARVHSGAVQPTVQLWRPLPAIYHPLQPTYPWQPHTTSEAPVSITRAQYSCIVWFIRHQCRCSTFVFKGNDIIYIDKRDCWLLKSCVRVKECQTHAEETWSDLWATSSAELLPQLKILIQKNNISKVLTKIINWHTLVALM